MTRSNRLYELLKTVKTKENESLFKIWKDIFDVNSIIEIYERLIFLKKEIVLFEKEIELLNLNNNSQFNNIIKTLNLIVDFPSLNSRIDNQSLLKNEQINITFASFEIFNSFAEEKHIRLDFEDVINENEFDEFKSTIKKILKDISEAEISEIDRDIFLSIFQDISKAISLYQINGLNAFIEVIRNNLCKIRMINEIENDNEKFNIYKKLTKKIVGTIWVWTIKYMKSRVINVIESKAFEFLDEKASEWAELPSSENEDFEIINEE